MLSDQEQPPPRFQQLKEARNYPYLTHIGLVLAFSIEAEQITAIDHTATAQLRTRGHSCQQYGPHLRRPLLSIQAWFRLTQHLVQTTRLQDSGLTASHRDRPREAQADQVQPSERFKGTHTLITKRSKPCSCFEHSRYATNFAMASLASGLDTIH